MTRTAAAVAILILAPIYAYAAPTYGTEMPEKGRISEGYQYNAIFDHRLNASYGRMVSVQHFFDISYGVYDWLSLDGKAGAGDLIQEGGEHPRVYYGYGFAGGYGLRLLALNDLKNKVKVAVGLHHISVHPVDGSVEGDRYESLLDEWQCSIISSKRIGRFIPFLGGKASRSDLVYKVNKIDRKRRPPRYCLGVVAGCEVILNEVMSVRAEGHFIDETSLSAGVYYKF